MLSYIHRKNVQPDSITPFMTTRVTRLSLKRIWHLEGTTYDCYFYPKHFLPNFERTGMSTEQTIGKRRMKDVHYSAEKCMNENANEPVKRVVGCGGCLSDGRVRAGISIPINTTGKCPVLPKHMKAELAAILAPTHSHFILGDCLAARLPRAPFLLQQSHKVTGARRVPGRQVHEAFHL